MDSPLSPELLLEVTARAKKQIRSRMKALRSGHPPTALARRSEAVVQQLLTQPWLNECNSVALFWPMSGLGEVDLRPLDALLRQRGAKLYYPFLEPTQAGFRTGFRESREAGDVVMRGGKFAEPPQDARVASRGDVDVVLVPALAADGRGHRIGYGAGYYDATLGDVCPPAVTAIVLYDFQLLAELPAQAHDISCDWVITDRRVHAASRGENSG